MTFNKGKALILSEAKRLRMKADTKTKEAFKLNQEAEELEDQANNM